VESNLLYTTEGKLITIREVIATGAFEYVQWDYDNAVATPEIVSTITSSEFSGVDIIIDSCECDIVIICKGNNTTNYPYAKFSVAPFSPFEVILDGPASSTGNIYSLTPKFSPSNITQLTSCVSPSGGPTTTTTSTTLAPTTTTTTSIQPNCSKWEITGPIAISYTDCSGLQQVVSVATGQTKFICANTNTPGDLGPSATLIGACDI
jgi:hypothetical protein